MIVENGIYVRMFSTRRPGIYGRTTCAASGDFLLLWYFVEARDSFFRNLLSFPSPCYLWAPAPLPFCCPASCTSAARRNFSVDPPASHSPVPPPQPRPPSAVSPSYSLCCATSLSPLFTTLSNINKYLSTFPLSWCSLLGPTYKT